MNKHTGNYRCQTLRGDVQITAETMQTYDLNNLQQHNLTTQLYLKFLVINTSEATKKVD